MRWLELIVRLVVKLRWRIRHFYRDVSGRTFRKFSHQRALTPTHGTTGSLNGGYAGLLYDDIPCRIGNNYFRVTVAGDVLPCCSATHLSTGNINNAEWKSIWNSNAQAAFRAQAERLPLDRSHHRDPSWAMCLQCPHLQDNIRAHPYEIRSVRV